VTLPIMLNGESVGTVGITGDPDRVERFGLVVRNQTEILLRESLQLRSKLLREGAIEDLLRDLAYYDPQVTDPGFIAFKAAELGYDLRLPRAVVVIDVDAPGNAGQSGERSGEGSGEGSEPTTLQAAILRTTRRAFSDPRDLVGATASGRFVVLHRLSAPQAAGDDPLHDPVEGLLRTCRTLADDLMLSPAVTCRIGVGGRAGSVSGLHDSYHDATNTLYLMRRLGRPERVTYIGDVRVPDLLTTVAPAARSRFARAVAGPLVESPDWPTIRETIAAWCESGFSLIRASAALHVHRNTLVYRLDKIEKQFGVAIRDPRTGICLYLASLLDELDDSGSS
jgi:carbohydrate diacid regulator